MTPNSLAVPPTYVNVSVPLPLDKEYTYRVVEGALAVPGVRVRVRFSGRRHVGVITSVVETPDRPDRILDVEEVLDEVPALNASLMELTRWLATYYACSWGEALRAALPPDAAVRSVLWVEPTTGDADVSVRGGRQVAVLEYLASLGARDAPEADNHAPEADNHALEADNHAPEATPHPPAAPATDVLQATGASHSTLRSLEAKGLLRLFESDRTPQEDGPAVSSDRKVAFHASQQAAAEVLEAALARAEYETFLVHGVTGSGKTEVYIEALRIAIAAGRSGIVLVPEIALTPQTVRRFRSHFGQRVAVLHSRLSSGARFDTWRRIRRGDFDVVIGPRSAVFAPLENLGLIVVDEEHEASYKQFEPAPRYNARDVAVVRAARAGAVCVLGSATPSLESWWNAKQGKYTLLSIPDRVPVAGGRAKLPRVRVVDLLGDRKGSSARPGEVSIISSPLRAAIDQRLERKEQIILLQNRRGFSPVLSCNACGTVPECPDCSVSLTWHKSSNQLRCHYCGRTFRTNSNCARCDEGQLEPVGAGTQRVEEEIEALFPSVRLLRMDLDTTGRKDSHDRILQAFGAGDADILVGTQMVAKGLDFGNVTLVGVVDADAGLLFPDFRADERTFQLLTQVAGRAGRADLEGEVIFQTRNSRHPVIRLARRHDYLNFATAALETRKALLYPPFVRAVRVEFRGPDEREVRMLADRFAAAFRSVASGIDLLGPAPAFIARVRKSWRFLALAKAPRSMPAEHVHRHIGHAVKAAGRLQRGTRVNIDVDPMGML